MHPVPSGVACFVVDKLMFMAERFCSETDALLSYTSMFVYIYTVAINKINAVLLLWFHTLLWVITFSTSYCTLVLILEVSFTRMFSYKNFWALKLKASEVWICKFVLLQFTRAQITHQVLSLLWHVWFYLVYYCLCKEICRIIPEILWYFGFIAFMLHEM